MGKLKAKNKNGPSSNVRTSITQDDLYEEAVKLEEQAERWILSDVVKTLRFYSKAYETYEQALKVDSGSISDSYNIYYNETRLLLKIFTEYTGANGYINVLKYVNLSGVPGLNEILLPLSAIIQKFEFVVSEFPDHCSWDLYFNLMTCYLTYAEYVDSPAGSELVSISTRFIELSHQVLRMHSEALADWSSPENNSPTAKEIQKQNTDVDLRTGAGIRHNTPSQSETELLVMFDGITPQTFIDTLVTTYKFIYAITEILMDFKSDPVQDINEAQVNYLEDLIAKFLNQTDDAFGSLSFTDTLDVSELQLARRAINGLQVAATGQLETIKEFLNQSTTTEMEVLLSSVDLLQAAYPFVPKMQQWELCCLLNTTLKSCQDMLSTESNSIKSGKSKQMDQLSVTVFRLCDVMVSRADNEIRRMQIEQASTTEKSMEISDKTEILHKNAKVLLEGAMEIAKQPCGLREYVIDKLKRNYIFLQAKLRACVISGDNGYDSDELHDLLSSYPQYCIFQTSSA
ncbi:HBR529Cp [Eremothecium sinecaudum]|uniref:HBR529Cp n=1 Tax=Eremothecium sinecaudum TaxID=45286 RepID=A0A109UXQ8_9SACH|nr:HBR529Cp [Eremothecium sinecaudum]AMD19430.1 HBR529Cp [Eremothecium sinecaudum]